MQGGPEARERGEGVTDLDRMLSESDLASETTIVLRSGKKKYALLRFQ